MSVPDPFAEFDNQPVEGASTDPFAEFDEQGEQLPVGNALDAITEPLTAVAAGAAGEVAGAARQGAGFYSGEEPLEEALAAGEEVRETMDEFGRPQTQVGAWSTAKVGDLMEMGVDFANMTLGGVAAMGEMLFGEHDPEKANQVLQTVKEEGVSKAMSDKVFELTDSPWMAAVANSAPEIFGMLYPVQQIVKHRGAQTLPQQELTQRIIEGDTSGELAKYVVDGAGKLKFDPVAQQAIDIGFDQGVLASMKALPEPEGIGVLAPVKGAPPPLNPTRQKALDMLEMKKKGMTDFDYRTENKPSNLVGDSALDRFNFIKNENQKAGKRIDEEADALRGQQVDFSQPINNFMNELESLGIEFNPASGKMAFNKSDIAGLDAPKNAIKRMIKRLQIGARDGGVPDAYDLHRLKRYIDESVSYGKVKEGLGGRTERVIKQLRSDIDDVLDVNFPKYNEANTDYATTINVINEFQDVAGRTMDLTGKNADRQVGDLMRRIVSNATSGGRVLNSIENLDDVARQFGGDFNDNLRWLMGYNAQLEKIFGSHADNSIGGIIESSVAQVMGDQRSVKKKATDFVLRKLTPAQQDSFDIMKKAIEGRPDPWRK